MTSPLKPASIVPNAQCNSAGLDHLMMARVNTTKRAEEVFAIYQELAADLAPVMVHSGISVAQRRDSLRAVEQRASRIIVCVDMLGEGYDLPALKVGAIHDAHKTLPITLQFLGRFTRGASDRLGDACVVVNRPDPEYDDTLRALYADDADWNHVIRELAQAAVGAEQRISDFEAGFGFLPDEVPIRALEPKMSMVVYRTQCTDWSPLAVHSYCPDHAVIGEGPRLPRALPRVRPRERQHARPAIGTINRWAGGRPCCSRPHAMSTPRCVR